VIVARHDIVQILIHIGALGQNYHYRKGLFALRAERPEPFDIGNCHNIFRLSQVSGRGASDSARCPQIGTV
jgi:hypothetical protein